MPGFLQCAPTNAARLRMRSRIQRAQVQFMDAVSHLAHRQNDMLSDNVGMEEAILLAAQVIAQTI